MLFWYSCGVDSKHWEDWIDMDMIWRWGRNAATEQQGCHDSYENYKKATKECLTCTKAEVWKFVVCNGSRSPSTNALCWIKSRDQQTENVTQAISTFASLKKSYIATVLSVMSPWKMLHLSRLSLQRHSFLRAPLYVLFPGENPIQWGTGVPITFWCNILIVELAAHCITLDNIGAVGFNRYFQWSLHSYALHIVFIRFVRRDLAV